MRKCFATFIIPSVLCSYLQTKLYVGSRYTFVNAIDFFSTFPYRVYSLQFNVYTLKGAHFVAYSHEPEHILFYLLLYINAIVGSVLSYLINDMNFYLVFMYAWCFYVFIYYYIYSFIQQRFGKFSIMYYIWIIKIDYHVTYQKIWKFILNVGT